MTLPLYSLPSDYDVLTDLIEDADEEASIDQALERIVDDNAAKVLALAKVVLSVEAEAELLERHARSLMGRVSVRRRRVEHLKRWILLHLEAGGIDKAKDTFVTVWLHKSPPSVQIVNEDLVPAAYQRAVLRLPLSEVPSNLKLYVQHLDVDRASVLATVNATGEVPDGVSIIANHRHVRIR